MAKFADVLVTRDLKARAFVIEMKARVAKDLADRTKRYVQLRDMAERTFAFLNRKDIFERAKPVLADLVVDCPDYDQVMDDLRWAPASSSAYERAVYFLTGETPDRIPTSVMHETAIRYHA
jgi:hypothetical protein